MRGVDYSRINPLHIGKLMKMQAEAEAAEYQKLSLSECGKADYQRGCKPSRWSVISADRAKRGVSRRLRIAQKAGA